MVEEWLEVRRVERVDMEEAMGAALDMEGMLDAGMLPVLMLLGSCWKGFCCDSGAAVFVGGELWTREGPEEQDRELRGKLCWDRDTEEAKALMEVEGGPMFRGASVTGESSWMGRLRLLPAGPLSSPTGSPPEKDKEGTDDGANDEENEEDGTDEDENRD